MKLDVKTFYDKRTGTATHLVWCTISGSCAVIDPVFDLDPRSGWTNDAPVEDIAAFVSERGLRLDWILETHIHHDHITGASELRKRLGGRIAISDRVGEVAGSIADVYGAAADASFARHFDRLLANGERMSVGDLEIEILATPGHTVDHLSYIVGDAVFTGDTLFMPDSGTARCDFHRGDAAELFKSIDRILDRADDADLFLCHDYGGDGGRSPCWHSKVGAQRLSNIHISKVADEEEFVALRQERDATLDVPELMFQALPVNIRAGELPPESSHGRVMLSIPLNVPRDAM